MTFMEDINFFSSICLFRCVSGGGGSTVLNNDSNSSSVALSQLLSVIALRILAQIMEDGNMGHD